MAEGSQVLKRLDFPAYCIKLLDNGLVAIAGGGGTSKTGVANSIELGLIDYDVDQSTSSSSSDMQHDGLAKFKSIHTFAPNDAIMKFVSFTCERQAVKSKKTSVESTNISKINDLFIAAPVNNTIEVYKLIPMVINKESNDTHSHTNGSALPNQSNHVKNRKKSKLHSTSSSSSTAPNNPNTISNSKRHLETSACLKLSNTIKIVNEYDESLSDPFEEMPIKMRTSSNENPSASSISKSRSNSKSAHNLFQQNLDVETISALAACKITPSKSSVNKNLKQTSGMLMCAGTSKGNIIIWNLLLGADATNTLNTERIRYEKLTEIAHAHGKYEIDDMQSKSMPKSDDSYLLSIGRDNHCFMWSLKTFSKINELKYHQFLNNDTNQRIKHVRFGQDNYDTFYATFIPRIRGGGKDMSSYVVRWTFITPSADKFMYKFECKRRIKNTIITTIQSSKDGQVVCLGDYEGKIYLFDANFNELIQFKRQHSSVITDLTFFHDFSSECSLDASKLILSISIDRTLQCYKYINRNERKPSANNVNSIATNTNHSESFLSKINIVDKLDVCSMSLFKLFFYLCVLFVLFCHYFTHTE